METKFNSQICTTREQSERLLALGLKKETADMYLQSVLNDVWSPFIPIAFPYSSVPETIMTSEVWKTIPAWSLHRLIELFDIHPFVFYAHRGYDGVVDRIEWLIKEGHFNKEYLCEKK